MIAAISPWMRIGILSLLLLIAAFLIVPDVVESSLGAIDFMQYWSSASLLRDGQNPYNIELLTNYQREHWDRVEATGLPVIMYNPPVIFSIILPFSLFSFATGIWIWLLSILLVLTSSCVLLKSLRLTKQSPKAVAVLVAVLLTSPPILTLFFYGQSSHVLFFALSGFFYFQWQKTIANTFRGGICLSLSFIKPHVFYLLYLWILLESVRMRRWQTLCGLLSGLLVLVLLPLIWQPDIWTFYWSFSTNPPLSWMTPTLGSWLQFLVLKRGEGAMALLLRFLPTICISLAFLVYYWRSSERFRKNPVQYMSLVLSLSLISAPYGWVYDQCSILVLVVLAFYTTSQERFLSLARVLLVIHIFSACIPPSLGQQYFVWYPLLLGMILWNFWNQEKVVQELSGKKI